MEEEEKRCLTRRQGMTPNRSHLADTIETSADELVGELKAVRDSVEELYILLDHIWRNRDELRDIIESLPETRKPESVPETIACVDCDADSPDSLAAALEQGWTRLQRDDGTGWNYLGVCPECQEQEADVQPGEGTTVGKQKYLFPPTS